MNYFYLYIALSFASNLILFHFEYKSMAKDIQIGEFVKRFNKDYFILTLVLTGPLTAPFFLAFIIRRQYHIYKRKKNLVKFRKEYHRDKKHLDQKIKLILKKYKKNGNN